MPAAKITWLKPVQTRRNYDMAHYGILRDTPVAEATEDIRGAHLYGLNDEKLGKIDDVIFDHSTADIRYVVVDTGGWLKTKKFLVPTERLRASAKHENDFETDLNKEQVESFPPYNESDLASDSQWAGYEDRYRSKWETDPVMHRTGTDRNITPTTQQFSGNVSSERAASEAHGMSVPPRIAPVSTGTNRAGLDAAYQST